MAAVMVILHLRMRVLWQICIWMLAWCLPWFRLYPTYASGGDVKYIKWIIEISITDNRQYHKLTSPAPDELASFELYKGTLLTPIYFAIADSSVTPIKPCALYHRLPLLFHLQGIAIVYPICVKLISIHAR